MALLRCIFVDRAFGKIGTGTGCVFCALSLVCQSIFWGSFTRGRPMQKQDQRMETLPSVCDLQSEGFPRSFFLRYPPAWWHVSVPLIFVKLSAYIRRKGCVIPPPGCSLLRGLVLAIRRFLYVENSHSPPTHLCVSLMGTDRCANCAQNHRLYRDRLKGGP